MNRMQWPVLLKIDWYAGDRRLYVAASKFMVAGKENPEHLLKGLFELSGLHTEQAGEGIAGIRI